MSNLRKTYIGIDIGVSGAITSIRDGKLGLTIAMPVTKLGGRNTSDRYAITEFIESEKKLAHDVVIVVEACSKHLQSQSVAASMWFSYMAVICAIQDTDCRYQLIAAKKWQSEYSISKDTKALSIQKAKELFPGVLLKHKPTLKHENDNISDSILLAEYGRRKNL